MTGVGVEMGRPEGSSMGAEGLNLSKEVFKSYSMQGTTSVRICPLHDEITGQNSAKEGPFVGPTVSEAVIGGCLLLSP